MDTTEIAKLAGLPPPLIAQAIETKVTETMEACADIFPHYQLIRPTIKYDLKGHTAGYAHSNVPKGIFEIRLNVDVLWNPDNIDDMVNQTVPHEVAHIVCAQIYHFNVGHGREWRQLMRQLGLPATRCHDYETTAARKRKPMPRPYKYICDCRMHHLTKIVHKRILKGRTYNCTDCGGRLRRVNA